MCNRDRAPLHVLQPLKRQSGIRTRDKISGYIRHLPRNPSITESRLLLDQYQKKEILLKPLRAGPLARVVEPARRAKPVVQREVNAITTGRVADLAYSMELNVFIKRRGRL